MYRDTQDALERHQSSMAAAEQVWHQELAAAREESKAKAAALQVAHHAALQDAHAELAAVMEQAAAALGSRPTQEQYIEVRFLAGSVMHAARSRSCTPLQTLQGSPCCLTLRGKSPKSCSALLADTVQYDGCRLWRGRRGTIR